MDSVLSQVVNVLMYHILANNQKLPSCQIRTFPA